ncbi:MAG: 3-deoxy-D-manno-octulosonic acid transferase [Silicimonas sp.]|nr:3-deoxy-D-manno-octulosonic acid transferase [Silicimonas sp.]
MIRPTIPGPPGLRYRLFLAGYAALMAMGEPLVWRYFTRRAGCDPRYGADLEERRGEGETFAADVWVHAVSLGEMTSAVPLVRLCLNAGMRVVTTHATPAGRAVAEKAFPRAIADGQLAVRYAPIDRGPYWRAFFQTTRPRVGLVMEMEFWPAMIEAARHCGVVLCLANSQVPSTSFRRARRTARLFGHPVARAAAIFAKSDRMAERFRKLGAERVEALGETRFDMAPPKGQVPAGAALKAALSGRPVVTFASVVAGEEEIYLNAVRELLNGDGMPLVIWVPRAPELFDQTATRLRAAGLNVARRSETFDDALDPVGALEGVDVLVGDSMGEMFFYLAPADAVVVGGGFLESSAHNIIEPLALGKPVITGPSIWSIEFPAVEAQAAGVHAICTEPWQLAATIRDVMVRGNDAATAFHADNAGASARIFDAIRPLLDAKGEK